MLRKVPTYIYMSSIEGLLPIKTNVEQARAEAQFIRSKLLAEGDKCIEFHDVDGSVTKMEPDSGFGIFVFTSNVTGEVHKFVARDRKSAEVELRKVEEAFDGNLEGYCDVPQLPSSAHPIPPGGQSDCDDPIEEDNADDIGKLRRSFVVMSGRRRRSSRRHLRARPSTRL